MRCNSVTAAVAPRDAIEDNYNDHYKQQHREWHHMCCTSLSREQFLDFCYFLTA